MSETLTVGSGGRPARLKPLIEAELAKIADPRRKDALAIAQKLGCSPNYVGHHISWNRFQRGIAARRTPGRSMVVRTHNNVFYQVEESRLKWLFRETASKLQIYLERVEKGTSVMAASEFARWVAMAGILDLVSREDSLVLRDKVAEVSSKCAEYFRESRSTPEEEERMLPNLSRKVDALYELISRTREPIEKSIRTLEREVA